MVIALIYIENRKIVLNDIDKISKLEFIELNKGEPSGAEFLILKNTNNGVYFRFYDSGEAISSTNERCKVIAFSSEDCKKYYKEIAGIIQETIDLQDEIFLIMTGQNR